MTISTDGNAAHSDEPTLGVEFNHVIKRRIDAGEQVSTRQIMAACMSIMSNYLDAMPINDRLATVDRLFTTMRAFAERSLSELSS